MTRHAEEGPDVCTMPHPTEPKCAGDSQYRIGQHGREAHRGSCLERRARVACWREEAHRAEWTQGVRPTPPTTCCPLLMVLCRKWKKMAAERGAQQGKRKTTGRRSRTQMDDAVFLDELELYEDLDESYYDPEYDASAVLEPRTPRSRRRRVWM